MNKILIPFLILLFFINGCKTQNSKKHNSRFVDVLSMEFLKWKSEFPDSLTEHFPESLNEQIISYGSSYKNDPRKILYLTLLQKLSDTEKQKYITRQNSNDSCLIRIFLERNTYGFDKKGMAKCDNYLPIPDYSLISWQSKIASDIKYYVIETSKHTFINHKTYLRYYLPEEWKNGMSRGVAISEKDNTIFYWLIMW